MTTNSELNQIIPGATLGVIGGGQLGRMFAMAAKRLGYGVIVLSPEDNAPAAQVADRHIQADYTDPAALKQFAEAVDAVTLEFENIPVEAVRWLEERLPVRPGSSVLYITQHRLREKTFLVENGFPVTPFRTVNSPDELQAAVTALGMPAVLKTAGFGYDGKGQVVIRDSKDAEAAWMALGGQQAVLEQWIAYVAECSVIVARNASGETVTYDVIENAHRNHILDVSHCPAMTVSQATQQEARRLAVAIANRLDLQGLLCIEFFVLPDGSLLINEMAPRPHNSGHLTIEACQTSQFDQQVRAMCNLPLGNTARHASAAMLNILGDLWQGHEPDWSLVLNESDMALHLYGKGVARPGRKMGHVTVISQAANAAIAVERCAFIRKKLTQPE